MKTLRFLDWKSVAITVSLLACAISLRMWGLSDQALWYDELQSVTHAVLPLTEVKHTAILGRWVPLPELLVSILQHDPHPPLYYVQLHFWMLAGTGDFWIRFNSVVISVMTGLSLLVVGRRLFGPFVGYLAFLLFALSPLSIHYAQEARMYSLLMALALWVYFLTHQLLFHKFARSTFFLLLAATAAYLCSHGASFLILPCIWSYAVLMVLARRANAKNLLAVLSATVVALMVASPYLYQLRAMSVGHTVAPGIARLAHDLSTLICGYGAYSAIFRDLALALVLLLLGGGELRISNHRAGVTCFLFLPIVGCVVVSHLVTPIWLVRTLAFTVPFLCLFVASGVEFYAHRLANAFTTQTPARLFQIGVGCALVLLFACSNRTQPVSGFREAAMWCHGNVHAGDTIIVPHKRDFWGFGWYFAGPRQVHPLRREGILRRENVLVVHGGDATHGPESSSRHWVVAQRQRILPLAESQIEMAFAAGSVYVWRVISLSGEEGTAEQSPGRDRGHP
jgi:mannosyltransferase